MSSGVLCVKIQGWLATARRGILAPTAEDTARACGADGDVPGEVGATCGELVTAYQRLRTELQAIPVSDPLTAVVDEGERLLHYHQRMLRTALQLAFSINPDPRREAMRRRLTGIGAPAARLNTVRGQRDVGCPGGVVEDALVDGQQRRGGVGIAVPAREVARRHLDAQDHPNCVRLRGGRVRLGSFGTSPSVSLAF